MPKVIRLYVRYVDAINSGVGLFAMYLLFVMMAVLMYSSVSKVFFTPSYWTLEVAQFLMVAYFLLGGGWSLLSGAHVRMDLIYGDWSVRRKAWVDAFTIFLLIFYLSVMLYGGWDSTSYSLKYMERSATAWRPVLWPVKFIMLLGFFLMLLQAIAELFKDIAKIRGKEL